MQNLKFYHINAAALCLFSVLIFFNLSAWAAALWIFSPYPALLAASFLAYGFGLRHAVDADHIAAIDTVTRKLMQQGQKPVGVGAFFSLGHATVVIAACAAIAAASAVFKAKMDWMHDYGGLAGTMVSAFFLLGMALFNCLLFISLYRTFKKIRQGEICSAETLQQMENTPPAGLMGTIWRFFFKMITQSWQMYLVGFLFGLGFDTATEVGLLGLSASSAGGTLSPWAIMVFPALFTSAMALVDSLDNFIMLGAYGWAFKHPLRKLYYNLTITGASALVALGVGGLEALGLIGEHFAFKGLFWEVVATLNAQMGIVGYATIAFFILFWISASLYYHFKKYDHVQIEIKAEKSC